MRRASLLILTLLSGCRDPHKVDVSHATRAEPKPADLVGTYVPDEATLKLISTVGEYPARTISIQLDADGALKITNIPDWWRLPADVRRTGFDSGSGTWRLWQLDRHQGHWGLRFDFPSMKDFDSDRWRAEAVGRPEDHPDVALRTGVLLVGEEPPYIVEVAVRRRGVNRPMRFTKVSTVAGDR